MGGTRQGLWGLWEARRPLASPGLWLQSRVRHRSGPRLPQPLQLDPQHKQRLFLQEELLRLLLADPLLEQLLTQLWPQTLQLLPQPTVCPRWQAWPIENSGWMANRLPGRQGPALFCSSDEGPPQPWWGGALDAFGRPLVGPEPLRPFSMGSNGHMDRPKASQISMFKSPLRPSGPTEPVAWHALHLVSQRAEPSSWI